jgi:hypothetical protein
LFVVKVEALQTQPSRVRYAGLRPPLTAAVSDLPNTAPREVGIGYLRGLERRPRFLREWKEIRVSWGHQRSLNIFI